MIDTIKKPVDIHTVSEVLKLSQTGEQISSRNTFDLADLCTHENINMWAKYKPFRSSIMFFRQDGDPTKSDRDDEMRRVNYGIEPPGTRDSSDIVSCINDVWTYLRPRGKNYTYNEPYRLSDFINYSHKDNAFMVAQESVTVNRYFNYSNDIILTKSRGKVSVHALKVSDFAIFDTYSNLAVLVTSASGGDVYVRVTEGIGETVKVTNIELNALTSSLGKQLKFAFLATNHAKTTSFTNILSNVKWLIMPNDGVNKTCGELVITSNFHHEKTCNGIANDASTPPLTSFTGFEQTGDDKRYYFHPTSQWRYSCYLDLTLKNTAEAVTLERSRFKVSAHNNLVTGNADTPTYDIPKMYVNGEEVEEVEVPAGRSVTIRFMLPDNIFTIDETGNVGSVVVQNRHISCNIEFYYNNVPDIVFSQFIRIRDYA